MKTFKKRGFLAKAGALLAVAALAFSASPSHAQDENTMRDMPEKTEVVITKLDQPQEAGQAADGLVKDISAAEPISGVNFEAYEVPVLDASGDEITKRTSAWQRAIAGITLGQAVTAIGANPTAAHEGTTVDGKIEWKLDAGLYLIRETKTPSGVVAAGDFLLAVPLTTPVTADTGALETWLDTVYVYPKNHTVMGTKTVENASDHVVGDIVTWTINADIPKVRDHSKDVFLPTDRFEIWDTLTNTELKLEDIRVRSPEEMHLDTDYKVEKSVDGEKTTHKVVFTEQGRQKLAAALPGPDQVTVEIDTEVLSVGEIKNSAKVFPGNPGSDWDSENPDDPENPGNSYETPSTEVRYGNILLEKKAADRSGAALNGAVFRVYLTEADAKEKNENFLKPATRTEGEWETDKFYQGEEAVDGKVLISGLRYSNFADGAEVAEGDENYQEYWLVEMKAPKGQQLLAEPINFTVDSADESKVLEVENTANTNGFVMPLTGGTGTTLLTILGIAILGGVVFLSRLRSKADA